MGTPYHLQSPRTILNKLISMKQQPPALLPAPEPAPAPSKLILQPRHRTTPAMWCAAIFCFAVSILVIVTGVVVLIVFLAVKPRSPSFDAANARLNGVYIDSSAYFNGDMTFVANVSNPNQKIDLVFQSVAVELFFMGRPMSVQALPPFKQRRGQSQIINIHMVSSQVVLPPEVAVEMANQVKNNKVVYTIRGSFRVQSRIWFWHYSYWMSTLCELELTAPPTGVLVARSCRPK